MNCRVLIIRAYLAGAVPILACVAAPASGQTPAAGNTLLQSARDAFQNDEKREGVTASTASQLAKQDPDKWAWFEGFRGTVAETNANLKVIAEDLPVKANPFFSVDEQVLPGDVLRVRWQDNGTDKSAMLVYVGEESFPDKQKKRSFFIWPYRTRLEYNTIPARKHFQYLQERYGYGELSLDAFYKFAPADSQRADTRWMQPGLFGRKCYLKTTLLNGSATYSIYRHKAGHMADLAEGGLPGQGTFGGTTYKVDHSTAGDKITITFDPTRQPSEVGSAERIGHVQVVRALVNGQPVKLWERLSQNGSESEKEAAQHYKHLTTNNGRFIDKGIQFFGVWNTLKTAQDGAKSDSDSTNYATLTAQISRMKSPSYQAFANAPQVFGRKTKSEWASAEMWDEPIAGLQAGENDLVFQFETWSWCEKGADLEKQKWYDGLSWEYRLRESSSGSPEHRIVATGTKSGSPSQDFLAAFNLHNEYFDYDVSNALTYAEAVRLFKFLRGEPVSIALKGNETKQYRVKYENILAGMPIEFDTLSGGCQYRAHAMCVAIEHRHPRVNCRKVFSIASGYPNATITPLKNGNPVKEKNNGSFKTVKWAFHAAPVVNVEGKDFVFDPSLCENPVSVNRWLEVQSDPGKTKIIPARESTLEEYPFRPSEDSTLQQMSWLKYGEVYGPSPKTVDAQKLAKLLKADGTEEKHDPEKWQLRLQSETGEPKVWGKVSFWRKSVQNTVGKATVLFAEKDFYMDAEVKCQLNLAGAGEGKLYTAQLTMVAEKAVLPEKVSETQKLLLEGERNVKVPIALIVHKAGVPATELSVGLGRSLAKHDDQARYRLPLDAAEEDPCVCVQAHNDSSGTHNGAQMKYALDFTRAKGHVDSNGVVKDNHWPVYAMRDGVVVDVKKGAAEGSSDDNVVSIRHSDRSIAHYHHLQASSIKVSLGQTVQAGFAIAKTGLVGGHVHEHLHVQVNVYSGAKDVTGWDNLEYVKPVPIDTKFVYRSKNGSLKAIQKIVKVKKDSSGEFLQGAYINY